MKKILKASAIFCAFFATFSNSNAASTVSATANALIVTPLAISESTQMQFGSIAASGSAGTITTGGATSGGATAVAGGTTRSGGVFAVSGEGNSSYTFTLPDDDAGTVGNQITLSKSGDGTKTMVATITLASGTSSRTLSSGSENVTVNGSLSVGANQSAGTYSGSYTVSVAY